MRAVAIYSVCKEKLFNLESWSSHVWVRASPLSWIYFDHLFWHQNTCLRKLVSKKKIPPPKKPWKSRKFLLLGVSTSVKKGQKALEKREKNKNKNAYFSTRTMVVFLSKNWGHTQVLRQEVLLLTTSQPSVFRTGCYQHAGLDFSVEPS